MRSRIQQSGAFILATVIFLMVVGAVMMYSMTNLAQVTSATSSVAVNGNMALAAAQSGLKYCLARLDTSDCSSSPNLEGISPTPCIVTIADGCTAAPTPSLCFIISTAYCPNSTDPTYGGRKITIRVQKTLGGYQMIPASRQVMTLP